MRTEDLLSQGNLGEAIAQAHLKECPAKSGRTIFPVGVEDLF
ncbi:hypothetical protein [Argonema antarcticum]|nr:hypothetical protein [Argonema antarcticum]